MTVRIPVLVYGADPVSQAGIASQLRGRPEVEVVEHADIDRAEVSILVADEMDDDAVRSARALQRNGCPRLALVLTRLDEAAVLAGIEAGACGFLRRRDALPERLAALVQAAAAGDGTLPPDLLGRLLTQIGRLQHDVLGPRGFTLGGLAEREIEVLRLVADGLDTSEIARQMAYSERTVKNVIHEVITRLQLRNRPHAVAYAMRQGLI